MIHRFALTRAPLIRILGLLTLWLPTLGAFAAATVAGTPTETTPGPASAPHAHSAHLAVGQIAPGFTLPALSGDVYRLDTMLSQGDVLLVFWSTHDAFSHAMLPQLKAVDRRYGNRGLTLAAIDVGEENDKEVRQYVQDYGIPYLVLNDDARKAALIKRYHIVGTPTIVLIANNGKILFIGHQLPDLTLWFPDQVTPAQTPGADTAADISAPNTAANTSSATSPTHAE